MKARIKNEKVRSLMMDRTKLEQQNKQLHQHIEEVTTVLAALVHRNDGSITITKKELFSTPDAEFVLSPTEEEVVLKLRYLPQETT